MQEEENFLQHRSNFHNWLSSSGELQKSFCVQKMYKLYGQTVTLLSWEITIQVPDLCQAGQVFSSEAAKLDNV